MNKKRKILWLTNSPMPDLLEAMGKPRGFGGSWLIEPLRFLSKDEDYHISVVTPWNGKTEEYKRVNDVDYYLVPCTWLSRMRFPSKQYRKKCEEIVKRINPDIIHLHGGEFPIGIPFADISGIPKILSVQGLISVINEKYFYAGIEVPSWLGCILPWNIMTYLPLKLQHARNKWRASSEIYQMERVDAITGCTRWDYVYSKRINKDLKYFFIDYAIRKEFTQSKWDIKNIDRHTILIGNMAVPLKGTHMVLEAVKILKEKYPDVKLRIIGTNTFKTKNKYGYARYLYKQAKKLDVLDNLELLGPKDTMGLIDTMLSTHTFVLSSSIENGPNILMESELLGLPCVSSYVGGAMQFAKEEEEALFYRFEEPEIMAHQISRIWEDDCLAEKLSQNVRKRAEIFDSAEDVYNKYRMMYDDLLSNK